MTFILAGNGREARNFMLENSLSPKTHRFISSPYDLHGFKNSDFIRVGTWKYRTDFDAILEILISNGIKEI